MKTFLKKSLVSHRPGGSDCKPQATNSKLIIELKWWLFQTLARCLDMYVSDRMAQWEKISAELVGSLKAKKSLLFGTCEVEERVRHPSRYFYHQQAQGIYGLQPKHGYSGVFVPGEYCLYSSIVCFMEVICVIYKTHRFVSIPQAGLTFFKFVLFSYLFGIFDEFS